MSEQREFGANTWLVEEMYRAYLDDPAGVGESWQEFFSDYRPSWQSPPATNGHGGVQAAAAPPATPASPAPSTPPVGARRLRGPSAVIAENMETSLSVPTATSLRDIPAKLLEVNRRIINNQLRRTRGGKVSFTHLIGWAIVQAMAEVPAITRTFHRDADGQPYVHTPEQVNLGLAVDVPRPDGARRLLVPSIKDVTRLHFAAFLGAYEELVRRIAAGDLDEEMFADTTVTLTNPGTIGTVGSVPRLMEGQSAIFGVGAIDYPAAYRAADPRVLAELGVGKVITVTSTYDHRVVQGAESGLFLKAVEEALLGAGEFYDAVFESLRVPYEPVRWDRDEQARLLPSTGSDSAAAKQIAVGRLINMYRVRGHLSANLNPLFESFPELHSDLDPATYGLTLWDLDRMFLTGGLAGTEQLTLSEIISTLRDAYGRSVGLEYMHIAEPEEKAWIQSHVEGTPPPLERAEQAHILGRLNDAEAFERFLHTKYVGHKRFGLEGAESAIPMLDTLLSAAADAGIDEAVMGMAHRGRLNVLANILGKDYDKIFREFEGDIDPDSVQGSGDVKYHVGARGRHRSPGGAVIDVELSSNPSHLEAVDPVVVGMARAMLDRKGAGHGPTTPVLPVLIHGDAAFAGQGVVAETFALSQLDGYATGGTVHLVINNQLGFTTAPHQGRSSQYATDVAKTVQAPIFHVNGDDPEACVRVVQLAFAFRQRFAKDVVVDLICYRRHGHNEGDEPSYTQPVMYDAIEQQRSVRKLYTEKLVNRGDFTIEEAEASLDAFRATLESALAETRATAPSRPSALRPQPASGVLPPVETGVALPTLQRITEAVTSWPEGFAVHPKLRRQLMGRQDMLERDAVDWSMAEAYALGSLALEGTPVRLTGQDSRRGTFSQRHAALVPTDGSRPWVPLAHLDADQAPVDIYDSPLSEFAAVGFEYGYSVVRKDALVLWEAQFGDFVNGAQVIIDQFLVAAEAKWGQTSGLVLLLPHGYEGQGPEHSSARIERFLILSAADNIQVTQPSTAAQYFHLLRRQMQRQVRKPLVVLTPKGMLRAPAAMSPAAQFTTGHFAEVLADPTAPPEADRVLLCSGRIAHRLAAERDRRREAAAIVRLEQLYPWPEEHLLAAITASPSAVEVRWVQDEPDNMGPWPFVHTRLHEALGDRYRLSRASRPESPSPATGSHTIHELEEQALLDAAFAPPGKT